MPVKKNYMTRKAIISIFILVFSISLTAQKAKRKIVFMEDSTQIESFKDYDKFTFTDTANKEQSGKVFFMNDSQFYFINYFNERTGKIFHTNEIKGIYALDKKPVSGAPLKNRRYYLSGWAVAGILLLTGGYGGIILIIREIYLLIKEGPGHSRRPDKLQAQPIRKFRTDLDVQIVPIGGS